MHFLQLAAVALLGQSVSAQRNPYCSTGPHIIAAPGRGDNTGNSGLGLLNNIFNNITARHPDYSWYQPKYNTSTILFNTVPPQILNSIQTTVRICPDKPIIMLGYSIGGISHLNALCGASTNSTNLNFTSPLNSTYAKYIAAVITYGEESFVGGQTWSQGSCNASAPQYVRTKPQGCAAYANAIKDYCNSNDPYCCTGAPGGLEGQANHYKYGPQYDLIAVDFIEKRLAAFKNGTMT